MTGQSSLSSLTSNQLKAVQAAASTADDETAAAQAGYHLNDFTSLVDAACVQAGVVGDSFAERRQKICGLYLAQPAKAPKRPRRDYDALAEKAKQMIVAEQEVTYVQLTRELSLNPAGVFKVLKMLKRQGVVGQDARRKWLVLLNTDGSAKEGIKLATFRRRRKKSLRARGRKTAAQRKAAPNPVGRPRSNFSVETKLAKLKELAKDAGPKSKKLLKAIAEDVVAAQSKPVVIDALKD